MASYLTLPKLKEYVESYLETLDDDIEDESYSTARVTAKFGAYGLMDYLESVTEINPEFVDMDAMRYRLAVGTLVARANDRQMTDSQQALFDALQARPNAPFDAEEFSSWIDDAIRRKKR